ncbi:MAG: hypothetical protein U0838_06440 [Chloroflexota bacterium]
MARLDEAEKAARLVAEQAAEATRGRTAAVDELARAAAERDRLRAAVEAAAPALEAARARAEQASAAIAQARAAREAAEARAKTARGDVEFLRAGRELAALAKTRDDVAAARKAQADAEAIAKTNKVDDAALDAIRQADAAAQLARGLLEQARPSVAVDALGDVTVVVDGKSIGLRRGATERRSVEHRLTVEVPGAVRLEVTAGAGDAGLVSRAEAAERALAAACAGAGVADLAEAEAAAAARRDARAAWSEQKRRIAELLGGDEPDRLEAKIAVAERRVAGYREARATEQPMPQDEEAADVAAVQAERDADEARTAETLAEREDRAARDQRTERDAAAREDAVRLEMAERDATAKETALAGARAQQPDDALAAALAAAATEHEAARVAAAAAKAALDKEGPDAAKALLDNAKLVLEDLSEQLRALEITQAEVRARLRDHGEDGLAERRDVELSARDAAASELERWLARAEARRKLYEALRAARDAAHLAYVGPLRDKITQLGSVVFGSGLAVDVGDDLRIRSRTLDGKTVPFESLSIGAREQLGVLTRLAGAMLVAEDGGVPVMLDDTLGFSDPRRLEAMGAVLSMAGQQCQVIVMTCYAERYRHVGGAKTVTLP